MYTMLIKFGLRQQLQYRAGMALWLLGDGLRMYIKGCIWWALLVAEAVGDQGWKFCLSVWMR